MFFQVSAKKTVSVSLVSDKLKRVGLKYDTCRNGQQPQSQLTK
jgi:hypothetical protein